MSNIDINKLQKLISLCKRRGIIFQSSEIYGGAASAYDYGPLGVELKNNLKNAWWKEMVYKSDNIVGLDSVILTHPRVWEASGHIKNFEDPLVECKKCHKRFKQDDLDTNNCPECHGELADRKMFNLMLETRLGPVRDSASKAFLRPETAQGIYVDYKIIADSMRLKVPFGIAQIGKAFRNEITPANFIFKTIEFEQAEQQFFVKPAETPQWFKYWKEKRMNWHLSLGVKKENLRFREHGQNELAHYAKQAEDIEYRFPWGWKEIEGIHNRGNWDISRHSKFSGRDLGYFDEENKQKFTPYIIETSMGVDRTLLALLLDAYNEVETRSGKDNTKHEQETVMKLCPALAPVKIAVFPLVKNKKELVEKAQEVYEKIKLFWIAQYDEIGAIGRRYRRQDEIGTPYCATIDFDTLKDNAITIRDRNTMKQDRIEIDKIIVWLKEKLNG